MNHKEDQLERSEIKINGKDKKENAERRVECACVTIIVQI